MTGQEKSDLLIQVTAWEGLTVYDYENKYNLPEVAQLNFFKIILASNKNF